MRYAVDTLDGLGFGKSDPFWCWTRRGAERLAAKLGPRARIRRWRGNLLPWKDGRFETVRNPVGVVDLPEVMK
jgi:hypothetical protein